MCGGKAVVCDLHNLGCVLFPGVCSLVYLWSEMQAVSSVFRTKAAVQASDTYSMGEHHFTMFNLG